MDIAHFPRWFTEPTHVYLTVNYNAERSVLKQNAGRKRNGRMGPCLKKDETIEKVEESAGAGPGSRFLTSFYSSKLLASHA
jgi:hypothetical protein